MWIYIEARAGGLGLKKSYGSYNDVEFGVDVQELAFFINDRQGRNALLHKLI